MICRESSVSMPSSGSPLQLGQSSCAAVADVKGLVQESWIALLHVRARCGNERKRERRDAVASDTIDQSRPSDQS